jgi:hypothetical protein
MPKFTLKKYVIAETIVEAIRKDKETPVADAFIDKEDEIREKVSQIGFDIAPNEFYYSPVLKKTKKCRKRKSSHPGGKPKSAKN